MRVVEFFQNSEGQLSAMRLAFIVWIFGIFGVWTFASIKAGALQNIPESILYFVGILVTGKFTQRAVEKKKVNE